MHFDPSSFLLFHKGPIAFQFLAIKSQIICISTLTWPLLCFLTHEFLKRCYLGLSDCLTFAIGSLVVFYLEGVHYLISFFLKSLILALHSRTFLIIEFCFALILFEHRWFVVNTLGDSILRLILFNLHSVLNSHLLSN